MYTSENKQESESDDSFIHIMDEDIANETTLDLKITPRHETIGLEADHTETHFCTTVTARDLPQDEESVRAPIDMVVALDISSSMFGRKLDLCKETLTLLIRELSARDRFGLITFGDDATIEIPTRKLTKNNKETAIEKIKKLCTAGCTNMSGGIGLAAQELLSIECPHEVQTIFVLTDGLANRGISDRKGILQLVKGCFSLGKDQAPIAIHCFGYGSDHNREILGDISQVTEDGTYYFVEKDSDVSSAFGDALGGMLSVVAQNTVLTFNPSKIYGTRIISILHNKAVEQEDGSFLVDVGDFYAEESRDIICSVVLANGSNACQSPVPHISVSMTYMDTIGKKFSKYKAIDGSILRPNGCEVSQVNNHVALQYIRVSTIHVIADAEKLAASGSLAAAKSKIDSHIKYLSDESITFGKSNPLILQLLSELNNILSGLSTQSNWESGGACYIQGRIQTHSKQRCSESGSQRNVYRSSKKSKYSINMSARNFD